MHRIVTNKWARFGAKIFGHLRDIAIFVLGYFISPHPVFPRYLTLKNIVTFTSRLGVYSPWNFIYMICTSPKSSELWVFLVPTIWPRFGTRYLLCLSVYFHSLLHRELQKSNNRIKWCVMVTQDCWYQSNWYQSKRRMRLPISRLLCPYLLSFQRYNDLLVENVRFLAVFTPPVSFAEIARGVPCDLLYDSRFEKLDESRQATRRWKSHNPIVNCDSISACDRQTGGDGRTSGSYLAYKNSTAIITSGKGGSKCFARVRLSVCLCLLARSLKNARLDLDELLHVDRCRNMDELIKLWARSGL